MEEHTKDAQAEEEAARLPVCPHCPSQPKPNSPTAGQNRYMGQSYRERQLVRATEYVPCLFFANNSPLKSIQCTPPYHRAHYPYSLRASTPYSTLEAMFCYFGCTGRRKSWIQLNGLLEARGWRPLGTLFMVRRVDDSMTPDANWVFLFQGSLWVECKHCCIYA